MEDLTRVSRELEEIAGNGGFTFKETLMTGDKMEESDKPRKVLGVEHRTGPASGECEGQLQWRKEGSLPGPRRGLGGGGGRIRAKGHHQEGAVEGGHGPVRPPGPTVYQNNPVQTTDVAADFQRILGDLKELREVTFPRSIKPPAGDQITSRGLDTAIICRRIQGSQL